MKIPKTAAEAAATRRRWINLAEIVAGAGLLIAGLTWWNSYQERIGEEADKASAREQAQAERGRWSCAVPPIARANG